MLTIDDFDAPSDTERHMIIEAVRRVVSLAWQRGEEMTFQAGLEYVWNDGEFSDILAEVL